MKKRMGENPLDMIMSAPAAEEPDPTTKPTKREGASPAKKGKRPGSREAALPSGRPERAHATFHLPVELVEATRDAVSALSGPPLHLTLASLAERALRAELHRLQKQHNGGEPFPRRRAPIRTGRPLSG